MGHDARVVIGWYGDIGHAWVVLFKDGKEYLLEATRKNRQQSFARYPLARYQTEYKPNSMFNRTTFWSNEGSLHTTSYSSSQWRRKSILEHM